VKKSTNIYKKSALDFLRAAVFPAVFTVVIMLMVVSGLRQTEASSRAEGLRVLEDSISRAVVICYAIEGRYPDSIEYIEEHYGVFIDRTRFTVHYNIFASNIFPEITVVKL